MTSDRAAGADERARQLVDQYTEIASMAGALAHEIKNPLSTIRLNLELLAEDLEGAESPRDRRALAKIRIVQRECQHLEEILDGFLRFARVKDVRCEPTELNEVVEEMIRFYSPQAAQHRIDILPYLAGDLPRVDLDRDLFKHALLNLILNAQDAMLNGGQLVLRTYQRQGHVHLELIDTGCGMDDVTLGQAFHVFYSTKPNGSGLGLPTARKIIDAHHGTISVQSEVGKGTSVTISLPAIQKDNSSTHAADCATSLTAR